MKLAISFVFLVLTGACRLESEDVSGVMLDHEFNMKIGQRVEIKTEELQIEFKSVLEDSRCPKGEQCITEGNGKIELELNRAKREPATVSLNTASGPSEAEYQGYSIRLISLNPYPLMNQDILPEDYEAVLVVSIAKNRE